VGNLVFKIASETLAQKLQQNSQCNQRKMY